MKHDVKMENWVTGSEQMITSRSSGDPAFSLGLIGLMICFFLLLYGCSENGRTVILRPSETNASYSSILVIEDGSDPLVPREVKRDFRNALLTNLVDRGPFAHGPELRIVYRITEYPSEKEGNSSDGKKAPVSGVVTMEVTFYNFVEKEIAWIQVEGDTGDSGRIDSAVRECARQVALYAKRNFK
jgi:hypothetical protein